MLRVHAIRFARRNAKEARIKLVNRLANKAARSRVHFAWRIGIGIIVLISIPAVGRNLGDRINAIAQKLPKRRRAISAWQATANADDGNGFVNAFLELFQFLTGFIQRQEDLLRLRKLRLTH